jgi:hypothetical protein
MQATIRRKAKLETCLRRQVRSSRRFSAFDFRLSFSRRWPRLYFGIGALVFAVGLAAPAQAQESTGDTGRDWGNYHVNQSIEMGGRVTSFTGNNDVYDTFVNLGEGVRLYNQTLEMRSLDHHGILFDNLFMSNFGYGGDPNDVSMLRVSKNKIYDFSGTFRRDRNLWNYDLLANPLNPTGSVPTIFIGFSPHKMDLTRRMSDVRLTLLPQSSVRLRLGYSRNNNEGPSLTTFHQGTEALLFQDFKVTTSAYQAGIDFKVLPRTNFSYDQFLNWYKGDTSVGDNNLTYQLANGQLVDLGVSWDTANSSPCKAPISSSTTTPPTATSNCNAFTNYIRSAPTRTSYPTEQFTFQSNYFKNVDMSGRVMYSSADARVMNYDELFQGFESRTLATQLATTGNAAINRTSVSADYAFTGNVTSKFRITDEFRFIYFRIPGQNLMSTAALFATNMLTAPIVFNPATCPAPYTASTCPTHNSSSEADASVAVSSLFLGQDSKLNTFQLEYDFTKHLGGRLGYRYRHRTIDQRDVELNTSTYDPIDATRGNCVGQPVSSNGSCTASTTSSDSFETLINESALLAGLWARPIQNLRLSYDQEILYADNSFTRISPRQSQHYKLRGEYKPAPWLSMNSTLNIFEGRDNVSQVAHLEHTRNYGFNFTVAPQDKWSLDVGYNYTGIFSQTDICFIFGSGAPPTGFPACPLVGSAATLQGLSLYNNKLNYGYTDFMVKPVKQVTMRMGYAVDSITGNTLILNPNSPPGPLNYNYHRPYGALDVDLSKNVTWRTSWGLYDYNEKENPVDYIGHRSFRGNLVNLTLRYSF